MALQTRISVALVFFGVESTLPNFLTAFFAFAFRHYTLAWQIRLLTKFMYHCVLFILRDSQSKFYTRLLITIYIVTSRLTVEPLLS